VTFNADGTRTVAVQTLYRDSAAQTDAYTPDYVLPPGTKPPEVLKLAGLTVHGAPGSSLPAGKAEIEAITLARKKARIEAALPPMTDEAAFEIRKRLMEQVEMANWQAREADLYMQHTDRLAAIETKLREREAEREFISEQRVEELRRKLEEAREAELATMAARRIKLLRKLGKWRQEDETHIDMLTGTGAFVGVSTGTSAGQGRGRKATRDIISEYADHGSRVYAPQLRDGRFPDKLKTAALKELHAPELTSNAGLVDLATHLPPRTLHIRIAAPQLPKATSSKARAEDAIAGDLERVHDAIQTVKAGRSTAAVENEKVPQWRKPKEVVLRPPTPTFEHEGEGVEEAELEQAVLLVQTLLRGRAVQNVMLEGKERRLELIHEMRADLLTEDAAAAIESAEAARKAEDDKATAQDAVADTAAGEVTAATLDFFSRELVRQREMARLAEAAAVADAERARREEEESTQRKAHLQERAKRAAVSTALYAMHSAAATTLVSDLVSEAIVASATREAGLRVRIHHTLLGPIVDGIESERTASLPPPAAAASVVRDLLAGLVVPTINREMGALASARGTAQYALAASEGVSVAVEAAGQVLAGRTRDVTAAVHAAAAARPASRQT